MKRKSVVLILLFAGLSGGVISLILGSILGFGLHFAFARAGWLTEDVGAMRWVVLLGGIWGTVGFVSTVVRKFPEANLEAKRGQAVSRAEKLNLPDLVASLHNNDPYVRYGASFVLAVVKGVEARTAVQALMDSLRDPEPLVRRNCGLALFRLAEAKLPEAVTAVPALTAALTDADVEVRKFSIMSLGALGAEARSVLPALRQRFNDPDGGVRICTCQAVAKFGAIGAAATIDLVGLLADSYSCDDAARALCDLRAVAPVEVDRLAAEALPECGKKRICEECGTVYRFSEGTYPGYWKAAIPRTHSQIRRANLDELLAPTLCPTHYKARMTATLTNALGRAPSQGK